jgi:hypothetical protein
LQKQLEEAEAVTAQLQNGVDADLKNVSDRTTAISRVMMYVGVVHALLNGFDFYFDLAWSTIIALL